MLIDLHTHSSASDGALSPGDILQRAQRAGIGLFAITDHDSVAGYRAAAQHYTRNPGPMKLVSGVEFSCRWSGATIHILGLGMDCDHPAMREGLQLLDGARRERGGKIAERLAARGMPGALQGALARARGSQLGRPHFAAWMVDQGHVADVNEAFDRHLGRGRAGDVKAFWPELDRATRWITEAGGAAVIAHPLKYRFTRMKLRRRVVDFVAAGGTGLEVITGRGHPDQFTLLRRLAAEFDLEVSAGSDFHRDFPYGPDLGVELPALRGLRGVWERWLGPTAQGLSA